MDKIFYTYKEVSKLLTVHRNTVENMVKDGRLKATYVTQKRVAIHKDELERYIKSIME